MFNVGIIGCGLIGSKRAEAIKKKNNINLCFDLNNNVNKQFSKKFGAIPEKGWKEVIQSNSTNVIFIATSHKMLPIIAEEAIKIKKPVFIEKPAAKNFNDVEKIRKLALEYNVPVHVGFNHRFHPSLLKAKTLVNNGSIGDLMFIRGRYGHGGRVGYDKEWRADPEISGGGELIDQGSHLIDLSRWFLGNMKVISSTCKTFFWNMKVEDNAFITLENKNGCISHLQVSCTEWKNLFSFEIYGKTGKLAINGLGGSYGLETIHFYKMKPEMGPPDTFSWEYPGKDTSWEVEVEDFFSNIEEKKMPSTNLVDASECHKIINDIYNNNNNRGT